MGKAFTRNIFFIMDWNLWKPLLTSYLNLNQLFSICNISCFKGHNFYLTNSTDHLRSTVKYTWYNFFFNNQDYLIIFTTLCNTVMYYKHYVFVSYWFSWQYLILNPTSFHAGEEPEPDTDIYVAFLKVSNILKWLGLLCHNCPSYTFSRSPAYLENFLSFFLQRICGNIFTWNSEV